MTILVTGVAGFIGMHVAARLLESGEEVVGIDSLTDYYDVQLKRDRLSLLSVHDKFDFLPMDIADNATIADLFASRSVRNVVHLAAQAGVNYSITNPRKYAESNLMGFFNVIDACRQYRTDHLVYASSSSVYGSNSMAPFSVRHNVDHPISFYAATKKANELMAHSYSHLYGLPTTGLRFFTVYGPWGRPDMSPSIFSKALLTDEIITIFNHGNLERDFTFIDDIVDAVVAILRSAPTAAASDANRNHHPGSSGAPFRIYNVGSDNPVAIMDFLSELERAYGVKARIELLPMRAGDVVATWADVEELVKDFGVRPATPLTTGVDRFAEWYRRYYGY